MYQLTSSFDDYEKNKTAYYELLSKQLKELLSIESDPITNMAQTAAFVFQSIPELNWSGFYRVKGDLLLLGPYVGKVACVHIPFGRGVCGAVAESQTSLKVDDVHEFDGHIACDSASNAELVVPVMSEGRLVAVLDLDSPVKNRFDQDDLVGMEGLVKVLEEVSNWGDGLS